MTSSGGLLDRSIATLAGEFRQSFRVLVLNGPRQAGKSTLMRQLMASSGGEIRNLDDDVQLTAALRDPAGFVASGPRPLYIDELQRAGDPLLRAVKSVVDMDTTPGRFVLAGSTRFLSEPSLSESLAGRAGVLEVLPFSQSELAADMRTAAGGRPGAFLDAAFSAADGIRELAGLAISRSDYFELMVRGGFPEPARMASTRGRNAWFASYVGAVTERDIREMARVNLPSAASTTLRGLAAMSSQLLVSTTLSDRADLPRSTVDRYVELLEAVFLVHRLQPWSRNTLAKAVRRPKVHLVDTGLLCSLLGVNARALANPTAAATGAVTETFVVNELRKQASWSDIEVRLYHYRDNHGNAEVDIVAETTDGRLVGFEVKAALTVTERDFRHLAALRSKLGSDFIHGFVVFLGQHVLSFGDQLTAIPLGALWTLPEQGI